MNVTLDDYMEPAMRRDPRMTMERATRRNKVEVKRTAEDDPARAAYVDELRAKRAAANGTEEASRLWSLRWGWTK